MSIISSSQGEQEAILTAAKLIMAAITTSPKGRGVSDLSTALIQRRGEGAAGQGYGGAHPA